MDNTTRTYCAQLEVDGEWKAFCRIQAGSTHDALLQAQGMRPTAYSQHLMRVELDEGACTPERCSTCSHLTP